MATQDPQTTPSGTPPQSGDRHVSNPRPLAVWQVRGAMLVARVALAAGFASAVADRLGGWGAPGEPNVAWGNLEQYNAYVAYLNPWLPADLLNGQAIVALGWAATGMECLLAAWLLIGWRLRWAAGLAGALLCVFGLAMLWASGIKPPLDYSVFAAASAAWLLFVLAGEKANQG